MLTDLGIENRIFYQSIPFLMRLLPLRSKPKRWHNNLLFRIRNKITFFNQDRNLLLELRQFDAIVISECYANAFWKNYFAVEELRRHFRGPLISYTESPLNAAPNNRLRELLKDDYDESRYDYNLFVSGRVEVDVKPNPNQAVVGMNIHDSALFPEKRERIYAVIDFSQQGYDSYRQQQIRVLKKLGIETIILEGRYPIAEIRKIYRGAAIFFLAFPETIGLPIAECLACGTMIAVPDSAWPMAWRINPDPLPMAPGELPACFLLYSRDEDLEQKISAFLTSYDPEKTPMQVNRHFTEHYSHYYQGDRTALNGLLKQLV